MKTYKITFDRIGRRRDVPPFEVEASGASDLAYRIEGYAGRFLVSREFGVVVHLDAGKGSIDGGRFGSFTIEEVPAP